MCGSAELFVEQRGCALMNRRLWVQTLEERYGDDEVAKQLQKKP